jgi:hypothetical protein
MRPLNRGILWAAGCVFTLGSSAIVLAQASPTSDLQALSQPNAPAQIAGEKNQAASAVTALAELPDSPGVVWAQDGQAPQQAASGAQSGNQSASQTPPQQNTEQEQKLQRPIGTAAAPAPGVSGITAAQPAGVAIAPAKQKRVRTIVIRVGAILGASAALGTVIALSEGTSSKPPGAH